MQSGKLGQLIKKTTSRYIFTIGRGEISCKSYKQTCIAPCTIESEFIALDKTGEEVECLRYSISAQTNDPYMHKL